MRTSASLRTDWAHTRARWADLWLEEGEEVEKAACSRGAALVTVHPSHHSTSLQRMRWEGGWSMTRSMRERGG